MRDSRTSCRHDKLITDEKEVDMTDSSQDRRNQTGSPLHRAGEDRIFAGVAGGLGEHFAVNAWWFRWAFIFLAFFAGVGVFVYVVAWLVIPGPDEEDPIAAEWIDGVDWSNGGTVFGVALLGVAGILLATQLFHFSGVLILAAVMFIVGLLLYRGDLRAPHRTPKPPASGPATFEADVADVPSQDRQAPGTEGGSSSVPESTSAIAVVDGDVSDVTSTDETDPPPRPPKRQKPPRPPRERSMLGRLTIAVGLIVVASMALIDLSDLAVDIEPFHYFAAMIGILGMGLFVGAWVGRARWLFVIGIILIPMLWISLLVPTSWSFSAGEFHYTPLTVEEVVDVYEQGVGQMTIDLTELTPAELAEIGTVEASLGLGEMVVRVPGDVGVELRAEVGAGEVSGPFNTVNGLGFDVVRDFGPEPTVLVLDLEVAAGTINITGPAGFLSGDAIILEWSN
jgi:phage shock protein PspC (stress-responsive transcriptional regulator)